MKLRALALAMVFACTGRSDSFDRAAECTVERPCACDSGDDCPRGLSCIDGECGDISQIGGPRLFGEVCDADEDCREGRCAPAGDGSFGRCTVSCEGGCPEGTRCGVIPDGRLVCVEDLFRLCAECTTDTDCHPAGTDRCAGGVCRASCIDRPCPSGYRCGPGDQCVPVDGLCTCAPGAAPKDIGCSVANVDGLCFGRQACAPSGGAGVCDAPMAAPEVCNGVDDDCDGLIDGEDPELDVSAAPGYPDCQIGADEACRGTWSCMDSGAGFALTCLVPGASDEVCDGRDNDCSGAADEPFLQDGVYSTLEHCGRCGADCRVLLDGLSLDDSGAVRPDAAACDRGLCRPRACAPGLTPFPADAPVACVAAETVQCQPCGDDLDCRFSANRCVEDSPTEGRVCAQGCGADAPYPGCTGALGERGCCPVGFVCRSFDGVPLCRPGADGGSCGCEPGREGVTRPCLVAGDGGSCLGEQSCGADAVWSECTAERTTAEVCDGADNDCDGGVDEPFLDTQGSGTYDVDAHCGRCFSSCLDLPNAVGECLVGSEDGEPSCEIERCLTKPLLGRGPCSSDVGCDAGFTCDADHGQCVRSCATDAQCAGDELCREGRCGAVCANDAQCSGRFGAGMACFEGLCGRAYAYVDLDGAVGDGCECPSDGVADPPDTFDVFPSAGAIFRDADCDGIDGVERRSLFVRPGASGTGRKDQPFGSIARAVDAFDARRHDAILVAAGTYREQVRVRRAMALFGGYAADFSERDIVRFPTIIQPTPVDLEGPGTVSISLGGAPGARAVTVSGFVVEGVRYLREADPAADGESSYAVYISGASEQVQVINNLIRGGRGQDGGDASSGARGADGAAGEPGQDAFECARPDCQTDFNPGGEGGAGACPGATGTGGAASNPRISQQQYTSGGRNGSGGVNATYSSASNPQFSNLCKYDCIIAGNLEGGDAQDGDEGVAGFGGPGCADGRGRVREGLWNAGTAIPGDEGSPGEGGGGGGAGGAVINANPPSCTVGARVGDAGASGGGGGAGGCGGVGGLNGGAGGGAFTVFVVRSVGAGPDVSANQLFPGAGGNGGDGGAGGLGGRGGPGGAGGIARSPSWCAGYGGSGGRGGGGGAGGGGGGGCGGPSFTFVAPRGQALDPSNEADTQFEPGAGGAGGQSANAASAGRPGADGAFATTEFF